MGKIGIMGGTFNPIHIGHLMLAEHVRSTCNLDEVWFMPTGCSYMKKDDDILDGETRYHMVELAISNNPYFKVCDMEIKRPGYTYTFETILELKETYPQHTFYLIYGADCLFTIEKWKSPDIILQNATLITAVRSGSDISEMRKKREELEMRFQCDILLFPFLQLEISSTDIRKRINEGKSVRYMIPDEVLAYITREHLYEKH